MLILHGLLSNPRYIISLERKRWSLDENYVYLMSVHNEIEAENVTGILETEGIKVKKHRAGRSDFKDAYIDSAQNIDIYVPDHSYERAWEIIEAEMVRGDL